MGDMIKTSEKLCSTCKWHVGMQIGGSLLCCDYICKTGKRRNCPVGLCDKYKKETNKRKKAGVNLIPWEKDL